MRIHNTGYRTFFYPGFLPIPTYVLLLRLRHTVDALPASGPFFAVLLLILLTLVIRLYQIKLGTLENENAADSEWSLRPYMNTARKRRFLSDEDGWEVET
jgi:hypothetical protein